MQTRLQIGIDLETKMYAFLNLDQINRHGCSGTKQSNTRVCVSFLKKKEKRTSRGRRDYEDVHRCIVRRQSKAKGVELSIDTITTAHDYIFQPCFFFQFLDQILQPTPFQLKTWPFNRIIHIPIIIHDVVMDEATFVFPW